MEPEKHDFIYLAFDDFSIPTPLEDSATEVNEAKSGGTSLIPAAGSSKLPPKSRMPHAITR